MDHSQKTQQLCLMLTLSLLLGLIISPPYSSGGEKDPPQRTGSAMTVENGSQRLIGTAVSRDSADSFAIIEDIGNKRQWIYREGDMVGKTLIKKIQPDRIIVDNGSGEEVVMLQRSLTTQNVRSTTTATLSPAAVQPKRDPTRTGSSRERYFLINGAAFADAFADPEQLRDMVEMQPGKGLGRQNGVRLGAFTPESLFSAFGLRTGDLLLAVNGQKVAAPAEAMAMLQTMLAGGQAEIKVRRRARTYRFHLQVE